MANTNPCTDMSRPCFARKHDYLVDEIICGCLTHPTYEEGDCPFCKPKREWTKGRHYPYKEYLLDHNVRKEMQNAKV
jgi:hypothetical protein